MFKIVQTKEIDSNLFSGLIKALHAFADNVINSSLESINLRDKRLFMVKDTEFMLVVNAEKLDKEKKLQDEIKLVFNLFKDEFSKKEIENWDGNPQRFNKFRKTLENEYLRSLTKLKTCLW